MPLREALEKQAELVALLEGFQCSQISIGMRDSLIIDFGELEASAGGQHAGALILAIECPWRIDTPEVPVVGWEDDEEDVADLATVLIGATITEVEVRRPGYDLLIEFSNEHRMRVFPDCRAYYSDTLSAGALPWQLGGGGLSFTIQEPALDDFDI
jgi:hypothetical protein